MANGKDDCQGHGHSAGINNNVLVATANQAPEFPDQDSDTEGLQTAQD